MSLVVEDHSNRRNQQLAGARQQEDEPGEVDRIEQEIASVKEEIEKLKAS